MRRRIRPADCWALLLLGNIIIIGASCLASDWNRIISTNKNGGHSRTFRLNDDLGGETKPTSVFRLPSQQLFSNVQAGLRSTFMPSGFPSSTPNGYLSYSVWSWIQDLSTQLRSVLATQRILQGVGVGRQGATALSALLNFLVRDGCGMAATLLFTAVTASRFNADIKRWRLFADIMVDVGITLEVAAAQVPQQWFLPMISVGNMCKAVCGVAAGACGGAINLHWAKGSDISDIQAKFGAQHTVTGGLGLVFAAIFARSVSTVDTRHLWILYSALTVLHMGANTRCMRLIAFDSFNTVRLNMALHEFLEQWNSTATTPVLLSSPFKMARSEPLLFWSWQGHAPYPIRFGISFHEFVEHSGRDTQTVTSQVAAQKTTPYWILLGGWFRNNKPRVQVVLHQGISRYDQTKAYFHAFLLAWRLAEMLPTNNASLDQVAAVENSTCLEIDQAWQAFVNSAKTAGWDLTASELQTVGYEIELQ